MVDNNSHEDPRGPIDLDIDFRITRPARLYNFLDGGDGNFDVDQRAAEYVADGMEGGLDTIMAAVRAVGDFTARVVRYLVEEAGVRQLLYVGVPVPAGDKVHRIAQRAASDARVVYVGNDATVMAHAHILQRSTEDGAAAYVHGSLRDPDDIWERATRTLDPSEPVAILLPATLCLVPDQANPHGIVQQLVGATAPGSHLMIGHVTDDIPSEGRLTASERLNESLPEQYTVRSLAEVTRFFDGLDLVEPGLVPIDQWRPDPDTPRLAVPLPLHGALALKP